MNILHIEHLMTDSIEADFAESRMGQGISILLFYVISKAHHHGMSTPGFTYKLRDLKDYMARMAIHGEALFNRMSNRSHLSEKDLSRLKNLGNIIDISRKLGIGKYSFEPRNFHGKVIEGDERFEHFIKYIDQCREFLAQLFLFRRSLQAAGIEMASFIRCLGALREEFGHLEALCKSWVDASIEMRASVQDVYRLLVFARLVELASEGITAVIDEEAGLFSTYLHDVYSADKDLVLSIDYQNDLRLDRITSLMRNLLPPFDWSRHNNNPF